MKWFVYRYNVNSRIIEQFNVFTHCSFKKQVIQLKRKRNVLTYDEFSQELKNTAQYYFWAKCEYEVTVHGWPPAHSDVTIKVDIFDQLQLNWDAFVRYVYNYDGTKRAKYYIV